MPTIEQSVGAFRYASKKFASFFCTDPEHLADFSAFLNDNNCLIPFVTQQLKWETCACE